MALDAIRISILKLGLDKVLGKGNWADLEPETIFLAMDLPYSDLMMDKVYVLQVMLTHPEIFYSDVGFMLHAVDVINNQVADFTSVPAVTSLEIAFAITEANAVHASEGTSPVPAPTEGMAKAIGYILREEGFSKPVAPFQFVPESLLTPGQTDEDTRNKEAAIKHYIESKHNDDNA